MPIYEYLCPDGHRFEVVQRFADDPVRVCEVCGKHVQRVLFAPAVHYKGKGFYATDYGRKGANGAQPDSGGTESGSKEAAASSSDGGSDSGSKSESKSSESKSTESKGSDSKGSGGDSSSSKKSDSSSKAPSS